jgi:hypothetical protein
VNKTASARKVWLPKHGHWVHFVHRDVMRRNRPKRARATLPKAVPATTLPVDCTGNATVSCPMLGNDQYGDCGPVMCAHIDEIRTYGQGKPGFAERAVNQAALVSQYEQVSGGDNGTDEAMLVGPGGIWLTGLAGDSGAVVQDHLDVDVTDAALTQFCHDQFYGVCVAWSVPDAFLKGFAQGTVWAAAGTPDPNNGHFTPISDVGGPADSADGVGLNGFYRLWTWGAWCWVSPSFLASVDPECFVTFSSLQFNAQGYDSHGRHVSDVGAAWVSIGGNATIVSKVVAMFPPKAQPTPPPTAPPTLAQAQAAVTAAFANAPQDDSVMTPTTAAGIASAALAPLWPKS